MVLSRNFIVFARDSGASSLPCQGFVAAAGQVVLSLVVLSHGVLIHSLAQTVHYLTTPDPQQRDQFLMADRPPRWYWGLIQVRPPS